MTDAPLTCDVSLHIPDLDCVFLISANENYVFFSGPGIILYESFKRPSGNVLVMFRTALS